MPPKKLIRPELKRNSLRLPKTELICLLHKLDPLLHCLVFDGSLSLCTVHGIQLNLDACFSLPLYPTLHQVLLVLFLKPQCGLTHFYVSLQAAAPALRSQLPTAGPLPSHQMFWITLGPLQPMLYIEIFLSSCLCILRQSSFII